MSYYLENHPNPTTAQYGWERKRVSGVIGVHTTESGVTPAGVDPGAENTAAFIARRSDHGSYHALGDWDTRIKLVRPRYAAWADVTNNAHAMSVSGAMNAARWRDLSPERAAGIVRNMALAAADLVRDAIADGLLDAPPPARRITAQQAIDGTAAGFYGHGETNPGTRYDPGTHFDWDLFLSTYAEAINEEDTLSAAEVKQIIDHINAVAYGGTTWKGEKRYPLYGVCAETQKRVGQVATKVWATLIHRDGKSVAAIQELADIKTKVLGIEPVVARIEENTDPDSLASLVPDSIAQQVIDKLSERLNRNPN